MSFPERLKAWAWLNAIILTQGFINVFCAGLIWVVTGRFSAPNPDEAFSSRVGRNAEKGVRLAIILARVIDAVLGKDHCAKSWAKRA